MSETTTRDLNDAMAAARRTASHSVTLLKSATGLSRGRAPEEPAMPAETAPAAPAASEASVISASTEMVGSVKTPDELHIHGKIEGDVSAAKIVVGASGAVKGDLTAETIIIHGAVDGRVHGQHVRLWAGAEVKGEISHGSLGIDTAAIFEGSVKRAAPVEAEAQPAAAQ